MSNTSLLYKDPVEKEWQDYLKLEDRNVITWSAARFPSGYASVEMDSVGQEFWDSYPEKHKAMSVGDVELNFIRKVFRELGKVLAPSFVETSPQDADITLMALLPDEPDNNGGWFSTMSPYPLDTERGAKFGVATWYDATGTEFMDDWEMSVVVHEIGHALHLAHPGGFEGDNPSFDLDDTIMSYNFAPEYGDANPVYFRDLDIHNLQHIWGAQSNPDSPEWPATEKFPSVVTQLPYSPPKLEQNVEMIDNTQKKEEEKEIKGSEEVLVYEGKIEEIDDVIEQINQRKVEKDYFKLARKISNKWWAKKVAKHIGHDSEMDLFVDDDRLAPGSTKFRKLGKSVSLESHETEFIHSTLDTISKSSGLDFNIVDDPLKADVVLSPIKMKKWDYYQDWPKRRGTWYLGWHNNGDGVLDLPEKNLFTQVLMTGIGFNNLPERSNYTTFDTIMSWNDEAYFGFTKADKIALEKMWGSPS